MLLGLTRFGICESETQEQIAVSEWVGVSNTCKAEEEVVSDTKVIAGPVGLGAGNTCRIMQLLAGSRGLNRTIPGRQAWKIAAIVGLQ